MDIVLGKFAWDLDKESENIRKHRVDFFEALQAFNDPQRKTYVDLKHSQSEIRYFCVGRVGGKVLTVRFTYRFDQVRIFGAGYWRKGREAYEESD